MVRKNRTLEGNVRCEKIRELLRLGEFFSTLEFDTLEQEVK